MLALEDSTSDLAATWLAVLFAYVRVLLTWGCRDTEAWLELELMQALLSRALYCWSTHGLLCVLKPALQFQYS